MGLEVSRQTHFIDLVPIPAQAEALLFGKRTIVHALTDDFHETIQKIRQIYLPQGSILLENNHLLEESIQSAKNMGSLCDDVKTNPSMNLALASNLETLRVREMLLKSASGQFDNLQIAHIPQTPEWESEIRASTDRQFLNFKTAIPADKKKFVVPWIGSTSERIWTVSTLFYPNPSADTADKIAGEDRLTAALFIDYYAFLKKKGRIARELGNVSKSE